MADSKDDLKDRLARYRQIEISVIGRKSGKAISNPVWFVLEGEEALSAARAGIGHAVVPECAQEPFDSN